MNTESLIKNIHKFESDIEGLNSSLETNEKKVDFTMGKKPMVTFIIDDGHPNDISMIKPLALKYNVPFVSALITDRAIAGVDYHMNLTQLKDLYNTGLWEFNSHTANHVHLPQLSEAQIREEYSKSIAYIRDNGLGDGYRFIVYPFVEFNNNVMKLTNEYFKLGIGADDKCNYTPIDSLNLKRVILGAYAPSGKDTVAYYKSRVDEIVANNGWLVFCMHTNNEGHNNTHLEEVIQYIKSINVDVVTVGQAYDYYANIMQKYYYQGASNYDYSAIGSDMNIKGMLDNNFKTLQSKIIRSGVNINTPITSFPNGTRQTYVFHSNDNSGFPVDTAGELIVFRPQADTSDVFAYQEWRPYNTGLVLKRFWGTTSWGGFEIENRVNIKRGTGITSTSPITSWQPATFTILTFNSNDTNGFPEGNAGTLEIYRPHTTNGDSCGTQTWKPYLSENIYRRTWNFQTSAWNPFIKFSNVMSLLDQNTITNAMKPSELKIGVTYTELKADYCVAQGFPTTQGGIIVTEKLSNSNFGFIKETIKEYGTSVSYVRSGTTGDTWTTWVTK